MHSSNIYYGATFFDEEDVLESNIKNRIELEYYGSKNENIVNTNNLKTYCIQIIKKEYEKNSIKIEKEDITCECENIIKFIELIEKLKKNKVTPICLQDIVEDLLA